MKKLFLPIFILSIGASFQSCELWNKVFQKQDAPTEETTFEEIDITPEVELVYSKPSYKVSRPKTWELINTDLVLKVDWDNEQLIGTAQLSLTPFGSYKLDTLQLNAKAMTINKVEGSSTFKYTNNRKLSIQLPKTYSAGDTVHLLIDYIANPNKLDELDMISGSDQYGLYFIDADKSNPAKPTQLWTQGETEYNSVWFPTIDQPNIKSSQSVKITVDTPYTALSNGRLVYMLLNPNGSRTYYWKQEKPHAPYLFMLAVGRFAVIEDSWNDVPISYYVEPKYAKYAKLVFGHTIEMMDFYSKTFGVSYPWDKYAQVVVRDFVSGAMENTGAVVHMDALQHDSIAHNDASYEDYIAHELTHQWFGNLVTNKSWAHLTLNEAFATYGEYLWDHHKYGNNKALETLAGYREKYFLTSEFGTHSLIHHYYEEPDDMFDAHSYDKGALVLHMLRHKLGDEMFWSGVKHYLKTNAFTAVDIHHLRISMETASGIDLEEFFDQWFLTEGHPVLQVSYDYVDSLAELQVDIKQEQINHWGIFGLNPVLTVATKSGERTFDVNISQSSQTFKFPLSEEPTWVQLDTDMSFLAELKETKPGKWWLAQLQSPKYAVRYHAWNYYAHTPPFDMETVAQIVDSYSKLSTPQRDETYALVELLKRDWSDYQRFYAKAKKPILRTSYNSSIAAAIRLFHDAGKMTFTETTMLWDRPSYYVKAACLETMALLDYKDSRKYLEQATTYQNGLLNSIVARVVANKGEQSDYALIYQITKSDKGTFGDFVDYLGRQPLAFVTAKISDIRKLMKNWQISNEFQHAAYELDRLKNQIKNREAEDTNSASAVIHTIDEILAEINE